LLHVGVEPTTAGT